MTLSYSMGLTTGSGVAYLINYFLGPPLLDPCAEPYIEYITTMYDNMTSIPPNATSFASDFIWNITIPLGLGNSTL